MTDLRDKIAEIMKGHRAQGIEDDGSISKAPYIHVGRIDIITDQILALLEKCPAMTIEQCPWGKENVEFREIFLRGINRQLEGSKVEEECPTCLGSTNAWKSKKLGGGRVPCPDCQGTGKIRRPVALGDLKLVVRVRGKYDICGEGTVDLSLVLKSGGRLVVE